VVVVVLVVVVVVGELVVDPHATSNASRLSLTTRSVPQSTCLDAA